MKRPAVKRRCCTYTVAIDGDFGDDELRPLARYLSTMGLAGCEVLIVDSSSPRQFEERRRILRWVGRHVAAGNLDVVHAAADLAGCEKVIVASADARYGVEQVRAICELLDRHEVVEPQEYVEPLTWWGGIDAGRLLLHRGVDRIPHERATFAFRRAALRPLRVFTETAADAARLLMQGAEVHAAQVFVRREPPRLRRWLTARSIEASADLAVPMRSVFFLALLPLIAVIGIIGGWQIAGGYAGVMAFASVVLAVRGRAGAGKFFPLRACLFAPLWIVERSLTIYWAVFDRLRTRREEPPAKESGRLGRSDRPSRAIT